MLSVVKQRITVMPKQQDSRSIGFLNMIGMGTSLSESRDRIDVQVTQIKSAEDSSYFNLTSLGWLLDSIFINLLPNFRLTIFSI